MSARGPAFSVEQLVARVLLVGGLVGIALVLLGVGLYAAHGGFHQHVLGLSRPAAGNQPGVFVSVRQVVDGLRRRPLDPLAVSALGLVLLMITPAAAVATAIPTFWLAGDRRYAIIAAIVLAMLVLSAIFSGSVH